MTPLHFIFTPSPTSLGAVLDSEDAEDLALLRKEEALVAESPMELAGMLSLQHLYLTLSGEGVAVQAVKDAHGNGAVEGANIGASLIGPIEFKRHSL